MARGHLRESMQSAPGQQLLVREDEHVDRAVAYLERGNVRQEVVTHEEAKEDEVVDHLKSAAHRRERAILQPGGLCARLC